MGELQSASGILLPLFSRTGSVDGHEHQVGPRTQSECQLETAHSSSFGALGPDQVMTLFVGHGVSASIIRERIFEWEARSKLKLVADMKF